MPMKLNYPKEHIIYTIMWIALYLSPVMGLYMRMSGNPHIAFSWMEILNAWKFNTVWIVLFTIHNFVLLPILLIKRRTWLYGICLVAMLSVAMTLVLLMRPPHTGPHHVGHSMPHHECPDYDRPKPEFRPIDPLPMFGPGEMVAFFGGLLLMGMNLGVKLYFKSQDDIKKQALVERHNLERQLEYLKYQVNPHFFMNTLNNIHALVDIDPERAKTTIVELSKMMRYILYEGNHKLIPLSRETQFLQNYVQLMRLRYTSRVSITLDIPPTLPDMQLPPLLLIIFVENAFKHGISYRNESFITIQFSVENNRLHFHCHNSKLQQPNVYKQKDADCQQGGMGLVNVRRRLDLLFHDDYELVITDSDTKYDVRLSLPLV